MFVLEAAAFGGGTLAAGVGVGRSCVEEVLVVGCGESGDGFPVVGDVGGRPSSSQ